MDLEGLGFGVRVEGLWAAGFRVCGFEGLDSRRLLEEL